MKTKNVKIQVFLTVLLFAQLLFGILGEPVALDLGLSEIFYLLDRGFSAVVYFLCLVYWWREPLYRLFFHHEK